MSRVCLLASEKPLPLLDNQGTRTRSNGRVTVTIPGFAVTEHAYYRDAVDALGFDLPPCLYELDLEPTPEDLQHLRKYLTENLAPGEEVELWSLWVGNGGGERPRYSRCALRELDLPRLKELTDVQYEPDYTGDFPGGLISQLCLTITC